MTAKHFEVVARHLAAMHQNNTRDEVYLIALCRAFKECNSRFNSFEFLLKSGVSIVSAQEIIKNL